MTLTGRAALVALAGGLAILIAGTGLALLIVNAVVVAAIAADLLLAASIGKLEVSRSGDTRIHLGQPGTVSLSIVNAGRRRLRGLVRDGWRPSAGAEPSRHRISLAAGSRQT